MAGGVRSLGWVSAGFVLAFLCFFGGAAEAWGGERECWREDCLGGRDVPPDGTESVAGGLLDIMRARLFRGYKRIETVRLTLQKIVGRLGVQDLLAL